MFTCSENLCLMNFICVNIRFDVNLIMSPFCKASSLLTFKSDILSFCDAKNTKILFPKSLQFSRGYLNNGIKTALYILLTR